MAENSYANVPFLAELLAQPGYSKTRTWQQHQEMQFEFLRSRGLKPSMRVLDMGCGPMRLGAALIPFLNAGNYIGVDINHETLQLGRRVLREFGIDPSETTLIATDNFHLDRIGEKVDIAFSNSLFSHLTLNSIHVCLAAIRGVLVPNGQYYSTFFLSDSESWARPQEHDKWGKTVTTFPRQDPYHYTIEHIKTVAQLSGFDFETIGFAHPTQAMGVFTAL